MRRATCCRGRGGPFIRTEATEDAGAGSALSMLVTLHPSLEGRVGHTGGQASKAGSVDYPAEAKTASVPGHCACGCVLSKVHRDEAKSPRAGDRGPYARGPGVWIQSCRGQAA